MRVLRLLPEKSDNVVMGGDRQRRVLGTPVMGHFPFSAENQLGGTAPDHVGRRGCPRPGNDPWHHGGVCHA